MTRARSFVEQWKRLWEPDLEAIAFNGRTCDPTRVDPKVLQWAKQNCSHKPRFIKIVNNSAAPEQTRRPSNCMLRFPIPFAEQYFRELQRVVRLESEDGQMWKVSFNAVRWAPRWQPGWFRFASDNNLKPGDVVVFVLVGNSHFRFTHFDKDGNVKSKRTPNGIAEAAKECSGYACRSHEESDADDEQHVEAGDSPSLSKDDGFSENVHEDVVSVVLGFNRHGQPVGSQLWAQMDKQQVLDPPPRKRRKLCKVGEISKPYVQMAMNNDTNVFEEA